MSHTETASAATAASVGTSGSSNAWSWSSGADGGGGSHGATSRYQSPFLQTPSAGAEQQIKDTAESLSPRSPLDASDASDVEFSGAPFRFSSPGSEGGSKSGDAGAASTPRSTASAKSPIGPAPAGQGNQQRSNTYSAPTGLAGLKALDAYSNGVGLVLRDDSDDVRLSLAQQDSRRGSTVGGKDEDYLAQSFTNPSLPSLTASPLSTPPFSSQLGQLDANSPSSPSDSFSPSFHSSSSGAHALSSVSQPPSRGEDANFEALEKSLTAMIFQNSQPSGSSSAASAGNGASSAAQTQSQQVGSFRSSPPVTASTPTVPSPSSGVAYVVLPSGQVQTVDVAALQQALSQATAAATGSAKGASAPPSTVPQGFARAEPRAPASSHFSYATDSYASLDPAADGELGFSLETLSTKTLPLFSPPTPPLPPHGAHAPPPRAPSGYSSHQGHSRSPQRSPVHQPHMHHLAHPSHSAYSSPATTPMPLPQRGGHHHHSQVPPRPASQPHDNYAYHSGAPSPAASPLGPAPQQHQYDSRYGPGHSHPSPHPQSSPPSHGKGFYPAHQASDSLVAQAKTQAGSRMLQTKLGANDPVYYARVFDEVYDSLPELMTDLFGNYFCQALIKYSNEQQRPQILLKVLPELMEISCDRQGTRAIQKLIESLQQDNERQLVLDWLSLPMPGHSVQHLPHHGGADSLHLPSSSGTSAPLLTSPHASSAPSSPAPVAPSFPPMPRLIHLIRDQNGSHCVHSILDTFPQHMLANIQRNAMVNCRSLGVDQHGLCILKKCLSMSPTPDFLYYTLKLILEHVHEYVNNQYGNYLVQHIIERANGLQHATASKSESHTSAVSAAALKRVKETDDAARPQLHVINEAIFRALRGSFARLSRQKFSSNVVEKMLKIPDQGIRSAIIGELLEPDSIASLLQCSYGHYVLQNVLYVASQDECALLFSRVRPEHVLVSLRKNIRTKWERLLANAHLIHPGLAPGGLPLPPPPANIQREGQANTEGSTSSSTEGSTSSSQSSQSSGATYPSPSAIQLINSILGTQGPLPISIGQTHGGDYSSAHPSPTGPSATPNPASSPTHTISPSIRALPPTGGHSPSFGASRGYTSGPSRSHTPTAYKASMDRRGSHSNSASAVNSPYVGAAPIPHRGQQLLNYNTSMSANNSPMHSPTYRAPPLAHSSHGGHFGVREASSHVSSPHSSPNYGAAHPSQHAHPRAPVSAHHAPSGGAYNYSQPASKYSSPSVSGFSHPPPPAASPPYADSSQESLQQQIQHAQSQLQALIALQAQQGQPQQTHSHPSGQHPTAASYSSSHYPSHSSHPPPPVYHSQQQNQAQPHYSSAAPSHHYY